MEGFSQGQVVCIGIVNSTFQCENYLQYIILLCKAERNNKIECVMNGQSWLQLYTTTGHTASCTQNSPNTATYTCSSIQSLNITCQYTTIGCTRSYYQD